MGSSESGVIQTYIETILELPWNTSTPEMTDIKEAKQILHSEHYAMEKVKERILEYLAVITLCQISQKSHSLPCRSSGRRQNLYCKIHCSRHRQKICPHESGRHSGRG